MNLLPHRFTAFRLFFPSLIRRQSLPMSSSLLRRSTTATLLASVTLLGACADRPLVAPEIVTSPSAARLTCAVDVPSGDVSCTSAAGGGANLALTLGGQGTYVELKASNSSYAADIFQADIAIRNLTGQKLGTTDGTTIAGVKAFIASGPVVTSGSGTVTVDNADGVATFTAANQSFFNYNEIIHEFSGTSSPKTWRFNVPSTVSRFLFTVLVNAPAPIENAVLRWSTERGNVLMAQSVWGADANNVFACANALCYRSTPTGWLAMGGEILGDSLSRTNSVLGMHGSSASDVWAVGGGGLIGHFDGKQWRRMANPGNANGQLNSVFAISPTDVYAVGLGTPKILHYDGTSWTKVFDFPTNQSAFQVKALSSNSVWVTGAPGSLVHWDGATWTTIPGPSGAVFRALWVFSDTDILIGGQVAGQSTVWRYDGSTFTPTAVPAVGSIFSFAAFSPTNVVATDGSGNVLGFDGTSWTLTHTLPTAQVGFIWAESPSNIYLSGYNGPNPVYRYDGAVWSTTGSPMPTLAEVWGTSASNVYAVGNSGTILHNTGGGWFGEATGIATPHFVSGIWGSSSRDIWAVGNLGTSILRRNATSWAPVAKATDRTLRSVWGASASAVWAVGDTGTIEKFDGTTWTQQNSGTLWRLLAVSGSSASDVWAVGVGGTILRHDGTAWSDASAGATDSTMTFDDVWAASPTDVWVVGTQSPNGWRVLLRWNGTTWTNMAGSMTGPGGVFCIHGSAANDVWFGGGNGGLMFHWNGSAMRKVPTPTAAWTCPWAASSQTVLAAGQNGVILRGTR
jgi:hypothetical protein